MSLNRVGAVSLCAVLAMVGCEEKKSGLTVGDEGATGCDLSADKLANTEWVILKINPDKTEVPDHSARIKFVTEDGGLKAKYNVQSVADMYTYNCESKEDRVTCRETPRVKDFCQALEAGGKKCDEASLKEMLPDATAEQLKDGIEKGMENVNKYKGKPEWQQFVAQNNNLGNKLRGVLYVKLDSKRCQLRVTDNYITVYNGQKLEDSNPVGTNPFVKNAMGDLLWEHCESRDSLFPRSSAELPADLTQMRPEPQQEAGKEVHFWYLSQDSMAPAEGCTYGYDLWLDGKPLQKGLKPEEADDGKGGKRLDWHAVHSFSDPSATGAGNVVTAVVNTNCAGKETKKVACAAVLIQ